MLLLPCENTILGGNDLKKVWVLSLVSTLILGLSGLNVFADSENNSKNNSNALNQEKDSKNVSTEVDASDYVVEITNEIEKVYGSLENFEKIGGLYFDEDGFVHLGFSKSSAKLKSDTNSKAVQSITELVNDSIITDSTVEYSTWELDNIKEKVLTDIKSAYTPEEYNELSFNIAASFPNQKVILEHNSLDKELVNELKNSYGNVFEEKLTDTTSEVAKGREEDWNQLGAGLGIKNINGGTCSTAGMASKNGNYFILTAAHCFAGDTSSTGGDLIRQYNTNVGRQHAIGSGSSLDVGLVRVTGTYLTGGRYATNKIKRWSSTDVFDGSFKNWTTMYDGVQICKTGKTTNTTCGTVVNANTTVKYTGYPTFNVSEIKGTDYVKKGDSGGAAFFQTGNDLYLSGIVSGLKESNGSIVGGYVTQYRDIQALYSITLYTSDTNYKIVN